MSRKNLFLMIISWKYSVDSYVKLTKMEWSTGNKEHQIHDYMCLSPSSIPNSNLQYKYNVYVSQYRLYQKQYYLLKIKINVL